MLADLLREGTQAHHARAESALPVMDADLPLDRYVDTLAALYGLYAPLERRLARHDWAALGFEWEARRKAPLLAADLRRLGVPDAAVAALPLADALPALATPCEGLGALYVLEGATLGGQLVRRHVDRVLGVTPERGGAFFAAYGDRVGPMWRAFRAFLDDAGARHDCTPERALQAARDTFDAFASWLARAVPATPPATERHD